MLKYVFLFATLLLVACKGEQSSVNAESKSPEYAAGQFFHALYNTKDLEKATSYATDSYARVLTSYSSPRSVTTTLYHMAFDDVTMAIDRTGRNLREQYGQEAEITMLFEGTHNGNKKVELRTIKLLKVAGKWRVEGVKANPFSRSSV